MEVLMEVNGSNSRKQMLRNLELVGVVKVNRC